MKAYAYDLECYPNLFTATFINVEDWNEKYTFYYGFDNTDYEDIKEFLGQEMTLVGYNSFSYDDPMLRYIYSAKKKVTNQMLFELSSKLVNDMYRRERQILDLRYPRRYVYKWKSLDLMKILGFDKLGISLKQVAINLKWHKIQDLPIKFNATIKQEQLALILNYNENDVFITSKLYDAIAPMRNLRTELSELYNANLHSESDSKMANVILESIYSKELGVDIKEIREMRTKRPYVVLEDCIAKFVDFQTQPFKDLLDIINSTVVYHDDGYKYSQTFYHAGLKFNLGIGGLHTNDGPGIFKSDDEYLIQDMDVASYYPNLIINNNFYPEHLGEDFITILKKITKERIEAKHSGDKVKADGLKITINSIFGKFGSETFWLLDAKQMLSTTLSGQLGLLMLVEKLSLSGIEVISCNTDGIVCRIKRDKMDDYYKASKEWEQETGLELEYTSYMKYIRRDVNNYITEKEGSKTKEKGIFTKEISLNKGYRMPIVAKALFDYYINGTPIRTTIEKSKDIMDFCISQKSANSFSMEMHKVENGRKITESLQKTNRFFISKTGGSLVKKDSSGRYIGLYVGKMVSILNDYDEKIPFDKYNVDISFYELETNKIIDEITPKQLSLFELSFDDKGSITKMKHETSAIIGDKQPLTIYEINRLGRNQFNDYIGKIVEANSIINNLNPRYVFVLGYDKRISSVKVYTLGKGEIHSIKVLNVKDMIPAGQVIFCNKFVKENDEFVISQYDIVDKFSVPSVSLM